MVDRKEQIRQEVEETAAAVREEGKESVEKNARKPVDEESTDYKQLIQDFNDNHHGDARRFIYKFAGRYCYDNKMKRWFRFNCCRWLEDVDRHVEHAITEIAPDYEVQAAYYGRKKKELEQDGNKDEAKKFEKKQKAWSKRAFDLKDPGRYKKVLDVAGAGADSLGIRGDEWNRHPNLFVTAGDVIDLMDGSVRPVRPEDYLNIASPVKWAGLHADSKEWMDFLMDIFEEDEELIEYVQKLVGYWMTGYVTIQEFYCLWGPRGRNGKGAFFRTLRRVLGEYYSTIPSELLLASRFAKNASSADPTLMSLRFARLAVASESSRKSQFSDDAIKNLTGGDPILVRGLYADPIEFIPYFKLLFATNRIPTVDGGDQAFRARLRIIPFYRHYSNDVPPDPEKKIFPMDPWVEKRLSSPENLSGILSWGVRGAVKLIRDNMALVVPEKVRRESQEYMDSQDLIGEFIKHCLIITDAKSTDSKVPAEKKTQSKDIYDVFVEWCKEWKSMNEKWIPNQTNFGTDFKARPEIQRVPPSNVYYYNVVIDHAWREKGKGEGDEVPF